MNESFQVASIGILSAVAALAYLWLAPRNRQLHTALMLALAVVSVFAYFNFGKFHGKTNIHHWEQFHYTLSAKYFDELRYDGLYVASVESQMQVGASPLPTQIRDLRNDQMISVASATDHRREVRARFSPERWVEFHADNQYFLLSNRTSYLDKIRRDHGFNASPTWVAVASLAVSSRAINDRTAGQLGLIDPLLIALALLIVWRCFGLTTMLWCTVLVGTSYAGRYYWIGGSLLRMDWLAALMCAACALQKQYFKTAGLLLGYATMQRIFPLFFVVLPALLALWQWRDGKDARWMIDGAIGYVVAVAVCFVVGGMVSGGVRGWLDFYDTIALHNATWLTNNVGLQNILFYDLDTYMRRYADFSLPEPWIHWQHHMDAVRARWHWLHIGIAVGVLGFVAFSVRRCRPLEAMLLGMLLIFCFLNLTTYYWLMLCLVPLLGRSSLVFAALLLNGILCLNHFVQPQFEWRYGLMSWFLAIFFVYWVYLVRRTPVPPAEVQR
jgi:Glycosyltransferase family 87